MTEKQTLAVDRQTTCSVLTGAGRSAIAVLEVTGPDAERCLKTCIRFASSTPPATDQVRYGKWIGAVMPPRPATDDGPDDRPKPDRDGTQPPPPAESVVVIATSPERFEVHCHGGPAAVRRLIDDLNAMGVAEVRPDAAAGVPADRMEADDMLIREATSALSECTTTAAAAIALDQVRGALKDWRDNARRRLADDPSSAADIAAEAEQIARSGQVGARLNRPFDVVLAGPPNVGKSSLINAMVGYDRSITMDLPGTTRDILDAETVFDGWALRLRDTAGVHRHGKTIERKGIERALAAIAEADLVVLVAQPGSEDSVASLSRTLDELPHQPPTLRVLNKCDLAAGQTDGRWDFRTVATESHGVAELLHEIVTRLTAPVPPRGSPVPLCTRQVDWLLQLAAAAEDISHMQTLLQQT